MDTARAALDSGDVSKRGTAKRALIAFVDSSPNFLARELDDIAADAIRALGALDLEAAMASLDTRTAELIRLTKDATDQARANVESAKSIRLTKVRKVVDSVTGTIGQLRALHDELTGTGDPNEQTVVDLVGKTIASIQKLRTKVEML